MARPKLIEKIDRSVVLAVIQALPETFYTRDVSEHPRMVAAHGQLQGEKMYHATVGKFLKQLADDRSAPVLCELRKGAPRGSCWQRAGQPGNGAETPVLRRVASTEAVAGQLVREGHYRTLGYMGTPAFTAVKQLIEAEPEIGGVYFRPTDRGATMVDLHPDSPKPRVGIGDSPILAMGTTAAELAPSIPSRIAHLKDVRGRQKGPSLENQLEARFIREAQNNGLCIPGLPERLRFIHSQWRIQLSAGQRFTDLLAVDLGRKRLVVIELKREPDGAALDQVAEYVRYFEAHASELLPFFTRVARVMGRLYGCKELVEIDSLRVAPVGLAVWPLRSGKLEVTGLDHLDDPGAVLERVGGRGFRRATPTEEAERGRADIGPQYASDPPFTARMRLHQSWYRAEHLRVPCGTGPGPQALNRYGNMLRAQDATRGLNFLDPGIFEVVRQRLAQKNGVVEEFRLLRNMLSSQPMCFNLIGPLVVDSALATRIMQRLLPYEVAEVTWVLIEHAPEPRSEYLADNTAFDAFIEYRQPDGGLAFMGVETKLTEPFSQKVYDRPEYRRWMESSTSPWRADRFDRVADIAHNQLWRDHLLAIALRDHPTSSYVNGRLMLVRHPADQDCGRVVEGYRSLLRDGDDSFVDMPLDQLVVALRAGELSEDQVRWLDAFCLRYLDLERSEHARSGR